MQNKTKVSTVKNLATGLTHTVPAGHFSLTSSEYELVKPPVKKRVVKKG